MPQLTSIDDLLERMVELGASDLHITVASPPAYRIRGHIVRAEGFEPFTDEDTRTILYRILSSEQQKHFELNRQLDFAYSMPGVARFRVNVYFQREVGRRGVPPDPHRDQDARGAEPAGRCCTASPSTRAASCSSPARPAPASRRPSPR